jgi:ribonuclease PH
VEVQGTGEHGTFARGELDSLVDLAVEGITTLDLLQQEALAKVIVGGV